MLVKVEAMGNCTYCKERINSLQGNNIFCIFWIFTSQDQASSTSAQHLREFSKKMIKALDPLGDPDVSHHFPGAGKLLLISFSNSRTTQSTKYIYLSTYNYECIQYHIYDDTSAYNSCVGSLCKKHSLQRNIFSRFPFPDL